MPIRSTCRISNHSAGKPAGHAVKNGCVLRAFCIFLHMKGEMSYEKQHPSPQYI